MQWHAKFTAQAALFQAKTPVREVVLHKDLFQQSTFGKHEIRLDGNLYDIQRSEWMGDSVTLVLYHDKHEQALYAALGVHFSRLDYSNSTEPKPLAVWTAQWLSAAFLLPDAVLMPVASEQQQVSLFDWHFPCVSGIRPVLFSPPRIVC